MTDVFAPAKRSAIMSRIRSKGNERTEIRLVSLLRASRISGWRRHLPLPGTPDFVFKSSRVAIFVDGCFWHGCPRCYRPPKSNRSFWACKIGRNRRRDRRADRELRTEGWRVLRIWQCSLRFPVRVLCRILTALAMTSESALPTPKSSRQNADTYSA